jgi:hypothetical protein
VGGGNGTFNLVGGNPSTGSGEINNWDWSGGYSALSADVNGDGKSDLVLTLPSAGGLYLYSLSASVSFPGLLADVTTGLGSTTSITYSPLTDSSVYAKDSNAVYPEVDVQGPLYVVSRIDAPNGVGGTYSSSYSYAGAKLDLSGRGYLGFRQMTVTDVQTGVVQTTTYRQDFPYVGLVASRTKTLNGTTLNSTTNSYEFSNASGGSTVGSPSNAAAPYQVSLQQSVVASTDLDGTTLPPVTTNYVYDGFGNPTQVSVTTPDGYSKTTVNSYTNDTANWLLGRLTRAAVTSVTP